MVHNRLKELLDGMGKNPHWLARVSGIGYNRLMLHYHNKAKMMRYDTLEILCRILGCQSGDLLVVVKTVEKRKRPADL